MCGIVGDNRAQNLFNEVQSHIYSRRDPTRRNDAAVYKALVALDDNGWIDGRERIEGAPASQPLPTTRLPNKLTSLWQLAKPFVGQRISKNGHRSELVAVARGTVRGLGYPRLEREGTRVMVSWSGKTGEEVKTAAIPTADD
jgi:hypothetical protein